MTDADSCNTKAWQASVELEVPFHDLDPMNIVWHGNYARYFELARCALLDRIEYNYDQMKASNHAWPVIQMQVKYIRPLVFRQRIRVTATLIEWEHRLRIRYRIEDRASGAKLTEGQTDQVAIDLASGEMLLASPTVLLEKLGVES